MELETAARVASTAGLCPPQQGGHAAIEAYERAVRSAPYDPDLISQLGLLYSARGLGQQAADCFRRAIALRPSHAEDHFHLGSELIKAGEIVPAIHSLGAAVQLRPDYFAAYRQLGALVHGLGDRKAAKAWYQLASRCAPAGCQINLELGTLCGELGEHEEAAEYFSRSMVSERLGATEYLTIGAGLVKVGQFSRGMECLTRSIELQPSAWAWTELGYCQFRLRALDSAETSYREALRCDPEYAGAHANLGLLLLLLGDYVRGFKEFEWRLKLKNFYRMEGFKAPRWAGEPLDGRAILIHAEQGYGDTLQFLRYVSLVAARGGEAILAVQPALHRIGAAYPGVSTCLEIGDQLPDLDFHCPLMSLPQVFGTTRETVPTLDPLALWGLIGNHQTAGNLSGRPRPFLVGLTWAGNPNHLSDDQRSVPLIAFSALGRVSGAISFVSLQHGVPAKDLAKRSLPFSIRDACSGVKDFADTAEAIAELDLVITVDTAIAHLAGSMGKPVWVLLGTVPEWRWGLEGETTPWYPSMRLFRAEKQGGWKALMERVAAELETAVREAR